MIMIRSQVLSVREVDEYLPRQILEYLKPRFYHASIEFDKIKKHQANLKEKRGHPCPWANKISEDAWVRRVRTQWQEIPPEMPKKRRGRPGWGFVVLLKIWIYATFEKFYNRNRKPLQAHADRYVIDIQLVAYTAHELHRPGATLRYRLSG